FGREARALEKRLAEGDLVAIRHQQDLVEREFVAGLALKTGDREDLVRRDAGLDAVDADDGVHLSFLLGTQAFAPETSDRLASDARTPSTPQTAGGTRVSIMRSRVRQARWHGGVMKTRTVAVVFLAGVLAGCM